VSPYNGDRIEKEIKITHEVLSLLVI